MFHTYIRHLQIASIPCWRVCETAVCFCRGPRNHRSALTTFRVRWYTNTHTTDCAVIRVAFSYLGLSAICECSKIKENNDNCRTSAQHFFLSKIKNANYLLTKIVNDRPRSQPVWHSCGCITFYSLSISLFFSLPHKWNSNFFDFLTRSVWSQFAYVFFTSGKIDYIRSSSHNSLWCGEPLNDFIIIRWNSKQKNFFKHFIVAKRIVFRLEIWILLCLFVHAKNGNGFFFSSLNFISLDFVVLTVYGHQMLFSKQVEYKICIFIIFSGSGHTKKKTEKWQKELKQHHSTITHRSCCRDILDVLVVVVANTLWISECETPSERLRLLLVCRFTLNQWIPSIVLMWICGVVVFDHSREMNYFRFRQIFLISCRDINYQINIQQMYCI